MTGALFVLKAWSFLKRTGPHSGSMRFEEQGSRIDDLKLIVSRSVSCSTDVDPLNKEHRVAFAASLFDQDGIQVRFMNSQIQGNNLRTEQEANNLINQVKLVNSL